MPVKTRSSAPPAAPRAKRGSGRRWLIGLALAAIAAVALVYSATRAKPGADPSPTASGFLPTKPNVARPPGPAPEGMVWIPRGEFSMGSDAACETLCGLPGVTRDAVAIHRVYVDGFWMDKPASEWPLFTGGSGVALGSLACRMPAATPRPWLQPPDLAQVAGTWQPVTNMTDWDTHHLPLATCHPPLPVLYWTKGQ